VHLAQRDIGRQARLGGRRRDVRDHHCSFHSKGSPRSAKARSCRSISASSSLPSYPARSR
jgi:hypothetical protein